MTGGRPVVTREPEIAVDAGLVRWLVGEQLPELASLPVRPARSVGTVNAVFRLGDELCVRLPRVRAWAVDLDREWQWLPRLAAGLPLAVPEPVARGVPGCGYPLAWSVYRWIEGTTYGDDVVEDERHAARDLVRFVLALRAHDPAGGPVAGRRPLAELDAGTRAAIDACADLLDAGAAALAWDRALGSPAWDGAPTWIHADLLRPDVLVDDGRVCAVIDFGGVGVGDPATDVIAAWSIFGPVGRAAFRAALDVDDGAWARARARGIALHQAALLVPYYRDVNPACTALGLRTIGQVLSDRLD